MSAMDLVLDHIGIAVPDLAQGRADWERLGFRMTDLSVHAGQPDAAGQVQPLGSGNHCAMFRHGYVELIGIVDPSRPSSVGPFLSAGRRGGFISAFGTGSAQAAYAALQGWVGSVQPPVILRRDLDQPGGGTATAEFRNIILGGDFPETRTIVIEHRTPELIWREADMTHPNGALGLSGITYAVPDPAAAAARFGRLLGVAPEAEGETLVLRFAGQTVRLSGPAAAEGMPGTVPPALVAARIAVADLAATRRLLDAAGVPLDDSGDALALAPDAACGIALTFHEDEDAG